jgi:hypothetical protein
VLQYDICKEKVIDHDNLIAKINDKIDAQKTIVIIKNLKEGEDIYYRISDNRIVWHSTNIRK